MTRIFVKSSVRITPDGVGYLGNNPEQNLSTKAGGAVYTITYREVIDPKNPIFWGGDSRSTGKTSSAVVTKEF